MHDRGGLVPDQEDQALNAHFALTAIATALAAAPAGGQPEPTPLTWSLAQARVGAEFERADRDGDARLSREELFRVRRLHRPDPDFSGMPALDPRIWGHFDADRDGFVSRQEVLARAKAEFDEVDGNRDGAVNDSERHEAQEKAFLGSCGQGNSACRPPARLPATGAAAGLVRFSQSTGSSFRFNSGLVEPHYVTIRDAAGWARLWNIVTARRGPVPLFPRVDFQREMVLVAAMGRRATGGYTIRIDSVLPQGRDLVATVIRTSPGRRCGTTQAVTEPADMVKVAATSRPIRWRFEDRVTDCR